MNKLLAYLVLFSAAFVVAGCSGEASTDNAMTPEQQTAHDQAAKVNQ